MGFINEKLSKEETRRLVERYHISDPWPYRDDYLVSRLYRCVTDSDASAYFGLIKCSTANVINGNGMVHDPDGLDGVGVLIWQDNVIRVDYYEDLMEARREVLVVATKIIAPSNLKGRDEEIIKLLGDAITTYLTVDLPPANQNDKYTFKPTDITFTDREDIWNL